MSLFLRQHMTIHTQSIECKDPIISQVEVKVNKKYEAWEEPSSSCKRPPHDTNRSCASLVVWDQQTRGSLHSSCHLSHHTTKSFNLGMYVPLVSCGSCSSSNLGVLLIGEVQAWIFMGSTSLASSSVISLVGTQLFPFMVSSFTCKDFLLTSSSMPPHDGELKSQVDIHCPRIVDCKTSLGWQLVFWVHYACEFVGVVMWRQSREPCECQECVIGRLRERL